MFKNLSRHVSFVGQFSSSLIVLPVHFFGRSIPCAGSECEACGYRSPRRLGYFCCYQSTPMPAFYEVCESFVDAVYQAQKVAGARSVVDAVGGLAVHLDRQTTRNAWSVKETRFTSRRGPVVEMAELLGKVAQLYRMPVPLRNESWTEWFERVRGEQNDLLRAALLPFGSRGLKMCS